MLTRCAVLAAIVLAAASSVASTASAGSYKVFSCGASEAVRSDAWQLLRGNATVLQHGDSCASSVSDTDGEINFAGSVWLRDEINGTTRTSPAGLAAQYRLLAPPGGTITALVYDRQLKSIDDAWEIRLRDQRSQELGDNCSLEGIDLCPDGYRHRVSVASMPAGVSSLSLDVSCIGSSVCLAGSGPLYDFAIAIYSSEVTIEENVAPSVGAPSLTGVGSGGWSGAGGKLEMSGSDTLGIRRFEVLEGDAVVGTVQRTCVDWSVLPCSEPSAGLSTSASVSINLSDLSIAPNELHQVRVRAVDAAGNTATSGPVTVGVDTTPRTPLSLIGGGLSNAASRQIGWFLAGVGAPAVTGSARICTTAGPGFGECREQFYDPNGDLFVQLADGQQVTVQLTVTDAAGNTAQSQALELSRDATPPPPPTLGLTGTDGATRTVAVGGEAGAKVSAQLCVTGGPCGDLPATTAPASLAVTLPNPGSYELRVTLTDAARNTSPVATLPLTRSAPLAEPKAIGLRVRVASNLRKRRIAISGSVAPGSTSRIALTVVARSARGRAITKRTSIRVPASGRFTKRLRLPAGATSRRAVRLTLVPDANDGWRDTRYSHTIRP